MSSFETPLLRTARSFSPAFRGSERVRGGERERTLGGVTCKITPQGNNIEMRKHESTAWARFGYLGTSSYWIRLGPRAPG